MRWSSDLYTDLIVLEQGLPIASGFDNEAERLPCRITVDPAHINLGERTQLLDDVVRGDRRIGQDLVKNRLRVGLRLLKEPFEMAEVPRSDNSSIATLRPLLAG